MGTVFGYGASRLEDIVCSIHAAVESGVTMFDSARMYGWGAGERLIANTLRSVRHEVTIATKFGLTPDGGVDSRPQKIRESVDRSLRNLRTDSIDLLYQHRMDPLVPITDVMGVLKDLVAVGKVRYVGLCEVDEGSLRAAHAVHPVSVVQSEYSIFSREADILFPVLRELGVGFVAYSPLARGLLAGSALPLDQYEADDFRRNVPWWHGENFVKNQLLVSELRKLATGRGITLAQLSLAWILSQGDDLIAIPGARHPARVEENVLAAAVELDEIDITRISELVPRGGFGARI